MTRPCARQPETCAECKAIVRWNYCRQCDEFFRQGHAEDCSSMEDRPYSDHHVGHRTY